MNQGAVAGVASQAVNVQQNVQHIKSAMGQQPHLKAVLTKQPDKENKATSAFIHELFAQVIRDCGDPYEK